MSAGQAHRDEGPMPGPAGAGVYHGPWQARFRDSMIAATALAHGFTVVTRNVADFSGLGVALLNPWDEG